MTFNCVKYGVDLSSPNVPVRVTPQGGLVSGQEGTYQLNICNRMNVSAKINIAITANDEQPTNLDWIEYGSTLQANEAISRYPIPLGSGWAVWVQSSNSGITASLLGVQRS
jgi:hypothetical protein